MFFACFCFILFVCLRRITNIAKMEPRRTADQSLEDAEDASNDGFQKYPGSKLCAAFGTDPSVIAGVGYFFVLFASKLAQ